jgi:hypothetical protein
MFGIPASRLHKVVGGLCVIAAPLLFAFTEITYPANGNGPVESLATGARQPALWLADIYVGIAASILFVVAYFTLLNLLRGRGAVLGHIAFVFALLGTCLSGLTLAGLNLMLWAMAGPGVDRNAMIAFLNTAQHASPIAPIILGHDLFAIGIVLFGIAVWRSGFGYRWAGPLAALAVVLDVVLGNVGLEQNQAAATAVSVLTDAMFVAGFGAIGWRILTMPDPAGVASPNEDVRAPGAAVAAQA